MPENRTAAARRHLSPAFVHTSLPNDLDERPSDNTVGIVRAVPSSRRLDLRSQRIGNFFHRVQFLSGV